MTDEVDIVESDAASRETLARAKTNRISLVARACKVNDGPDEPDEVVSKDTKS